MLTDGHATGTAAFAVLAVAGDVGVGPVGRLVAFVPPAPLPVGTQLAKATPPKAKTMTPTRRVTAVLVRICLLPRMS
jgi:hypothetical protein